MCKTKDDFMKDKDLCDIVEIFGNKRVIKGDYEVIVNDCDFPTKRVRTINLYKKDSMFLLGQIELDLTNKIVTIYEQHNYEASKAMAQLLVDKYDYTLSIYPRTTL